MIHKNSKRDWGAPRPPHNQVQPWENMKKHPPRCPKDIFPEVFSIKLSFLHLISNELDGVSNNSLN